MSDAARRADGLVTGVFVEFDGIEFVALHTDPECAPSDAKGPVRVGRGSPADWCDECGSEP